jgi:arylformamidase
MPRIYDVTVPLSKDVPTFPGDPRFEMDFAHRIEEGKPYNVAYLKLGAHAGTHVDAPFHFLRNGRTVDQLPLEVLMGRARVVEIASRALISRGDVEAADLAGATRVLFKTRNSGTLLRPEFREDFVALAPEAAAWLVKAGMTLVGVDYLSVEKFGSEDFAAHHALLGAGVVIVEGLDLSEVPPGDYDLTCLPLRIVGADGSPARVVLRSA